MEKARDNVAKHGVSFEEAQTLMDNTMAYWIPDIEHGARETRSQVIGYSSTGTLLLVVTSEDGPRPRIISALRATKRERHAYEARS